MLTHHSNVDTARERQQLQLYSERESCTAGKSVNLYYYTTGQDLTSIFAGIFDIPVVDHTVLNNSANITNHQFCNNMHE